MPWFSIIEYQALSQLIYSPLSLSSRGSLVPICILPLGWCHLHICGCWYFSWQSLFQLVIHPAQHFTWYTLHNIWISRVTIFKPCHTPFTILNQSIVPRSILTVAFWPAYRFLKRQVRWSGIPISLSDSHLFIVIHTVKGFGMVNKAKVDLFLELACFFNDPADAGPIISW